MQRMMLLLLFSWPANTFLAAWSAVIPSLGSPLRAGDVYQKVVYYGKFWTSCCWPYRSPGCCGWLAVHLLFPHECRGENWLWCLDYALHRVSDDSNVLDLGDQSRGVANRDAI